MPNEQDKVVVIHLKPGERVQVGDTEVKVKRWRNGRVEIVLTGPEGVERSLTDEPREA